MATTEPAGNPSPLAPGNPTPMQDELAHKAQKVKWLVVDVDGVLTDGTAFYGHGGFEGVAFDIQDGAGIKYLKRLGIRTAIISGRTAHAVLYRARELGIDDVIQGAKVKNVAYEALKERLGFQDSEVCYMGDDLPDLPIMRRVGLAAAVSNARPEVREAADLVTSASGGRGAVRELAEFILKAQGKWGEILGRYVQ